MNAARREKLIRLSELRDASRRTAAEFLSSHQAEMEAYRQQISLGIDDALKRLREEVEGLSAGNRVAVRLAEQASEYAAWCQWSLWDLPVLAVALRPRLEVFRQAVVACGLVYIAVRVFDDAIDQHFSYKGRRDTLLAAVSESHPNTQKAVGLNTLAGLLLCFEGLKGLTDPGQPELSSTLRSLVGSIRRVVVGLIMEYTDVHEWSLAGYDRLVQLKNVDYWRGLYSALDPEHTSILYPFWEKYYELAQNLNDVQDYEEDLRRGQPNLVSLNELNGSNGQGECLPVDAVPQRVPSEVELLIADKFLALAATIEGVSGRERGVALSKLSDSLEAAYRLGLFAPSPSEAEHRPPPRVPRVFWFSELADVIEEAGSLALVHVGCAVCGSLQRRTLFRKQGFPYHRCLECGHVYVSPRITAEIQAQMQLEPEGPTSEDKYLEVQRLYAESICHMLRLRTPGARLLDVGFGRGYLMRMAQVYGFEVYGVDSSRVHVERLIPEFGDRVARCVVGREAFPWNAFDVVVMSHVVEHLPDPEATLREVAGLLNPGGLLYVAVPDLGSTHFKIFGKHWEVTSPLIHLQYFSEASLSRLLEKCDLERIERIRHRPLPDEISPRWVRLMRHLGGSDSSELAMLARIPEAGQGRG